MKKIHLIAVIVFALFGCGPRETPTSDENQAIVRAYKLIDAGRAVDAANLIRPYFEKNFHRVSLRVTLASAEVAQADLRIPRFYALIESLLDEALSSTPDLVARARAAAAQVPSDLRDQSLPLLKTFLTLNDWLVRLNELPEIGRPQIGHLRIALNLLAEVPETEKGVVLYRSVLSAIEIRFRIEKEFLPAHLLHRGNRCSLKLDHFDVDLDLVTGKLQSLSQDMARLYPETFKEGLQISKFLVQISEQIHDIVQRNELGGDWQWPCGG